MDAYRSPAGRSAVQRWCSAALDRWTVPHRTLRLDVPLGDGSVATHVTVVGEGAPRYLWLPGTASSATSSLTALEVLSRHGTVWALDLPGQPGLSQPERPRHDLTVWYSTWLEAVLDEIATLPGSGDVTLVGSSLGAAVALSADRPAVTARFLLAPGGLLPVSTSPSLVRDHTRWSLHASPASARALMRHLVAPGEPVSDCAVEWLTLVGRACKTIRSPRPLPQHYLDRIDGAPLRVVVGEDDKLVPPTPLTSSVARRTSARVTVLEGCGHLIPSDRWEQVFRVLPA
ncbi:hypothetical protein ADJ73_10530 [Arsenicicoccus sp. oral taxon 190]|nr:hypothetical protein ADJ73_10530 [Arsenicicoccus sp. oral taxon 190]